MKMKKINEEKVLIELSNNELSMLKVILRYALSVNKGLQQVGEIPIYDYISDEEKIIINYILNI